MSEGRTTFVKPKYLSDEWFKVRRTIDGGTVFGASECPALMGVSPFDTLEDLVIKKINPQFVQNNPATLRGHILEPALIDHCRNEYNADIEVPEVMFRRQRLVATLDGVEFEGGKPKRVFEAKTTTAYSVDEPLPASYFWQGQAQLETTGADYVVFVCLDRNMRIGFWELYPDFEAIKELQNQAELIGKKIDSNEYITNRDIPFTSQQIEALFPEPEGEIELDGSFINLIEMWGALKEQSDAVKAQEQEIKNQIANAMRDKEYGIIGGQRVLSYKRQTRKGGVDYEGFIKSNPHLAEALKDFKKPDSEFRVLRRLANKQTNNQN